MENLNLKQKIIFITIISVMIFVIAYYFFNKTKQEEYEKWKNSEGKNINTPDELIELIQSDIKKQGADKSPLP